MERYKRNGIFTKEEMKTLFDSKVCIVGCGGLGGYILEMLSRVGVGNITVVDGDVFEESNLNRQILSTTTNIGKSKVHEAKKRVLDVNPDTVLTVVHEFLGTDNVSDIISGSDIAIDALDSIDIRLLLQEECENQRIPLVHGAIAGWYGQITTIMPGDRTLNRLYQNGQGEGIEAEIGNPSFTPGLVASLEVSEAIKVLLNKEEILRNKILYVDLLDNEFHILNI
jgi:molybdopterin/thiamine biosynthesis adenylyltransferase